MADEEGMELLPDGTIRWGWAVAAGKRARFTMRRPTLGEFRKLREQLHTLQDETSDAQIKTADASRVILEATTERKYDDLPEARTVVRDQTERIEEANMGWLRESFDLLADKPLPASDDLPAWFSGAGALITEMVNHWRVRPLASGGA